jgi:hypothetical protein
MNWLWWERDKSGWEREFHRSRWVQKGNGTFP